MLWRLSTLLLIATALSACGSVERTQVDGGAAGVGGTSGTGGVGGSAETGGAEGSFGIWATQGNMAVEFLEEVQTSRCCEDTLPEFGITAKNTKPDGSIDQIGIFVGPHPEFDSISCEQGGAKVVVTWYLPNGEVFNEYRTDSALSECNVRVTEIGNPGGDFSGTFSALLRDANEGRLVFSEGSFRGRL